MSNKISSVLLAAVVLSAASVAQAQSVTTDPAGVVTGSRGASVAASDPNVDRGFLLPTALTQPAGSVTYNNYELLLHGLTYGVTDRIQATLTVLSPITTDMPFVGFGAVKVQLLSTDLLHLAAQGSVGYAHVFQNGDGGGPSNGYSLGAGAFGTLCLGDECSSALSASAIYQTVVGTASEADLFPSFLVYGGSIVQRVSRRVKLLGEVTSAAGRADAGSNFENVDGVLVSYGVRFHTDSIAGDVGFVKPFAGSGSDGFLMGFPFVNLSYRWN